MPSFCSSCQQYSALLRTPSLSKYMSQVPFWTLYFCGSFLNYSVIPPSPLTSDLPCTFFESTGIWKQPVLHPILFSFSILSVGNLCSTVEHNAFYFFSCLKRYLPCVSGHSQHICCQNWLLNQFHLKSLIFADTCNSLTHFLLLVSYLRNCCLVQTLKKLYVCFLPIIADCF